jgi:hypothetical protein
MSRAGAARLYTQTRWLVSWNVSGASEPGGLLTLLDAQRKLTRTLARRRRVATVPGKDAQVLEPEPV